MSLAAKTLKTQKNVTSNRKLRDVKMSKCHSEEVSNGKKWRLLLKRKERRLLLFCEREPRLLFHFPGELRARLRCKKYAMPRKSQ